MQHTLLVSAVKENNTIRFLSSIRLAASSVNGSKRRRCHGNAMQRYPASSESYQVVFVFLELALESICLSLPTNGLVAPQIPHSGSTTFFLEIECSL